MNELMINELMINDWILAHFTYPAKITEIKANGSICTNLAGKQIDDTDWVPISSTTEILKLNGFTYDVNEKCWKLIKKDNDRLVYSIYVNADRLSVCNWRFEENEYFVNVCNEVNVYYTYVHEIQHALRMCGLNDLANNFKIE